MRASATILMLLTVMALAPGARAQDAPPANDNFEQRTILPPPPGQADSLPYRQFQETGGATLEPGEVTAPCGDTQATVWFEVFPGVDEPTRLVLDTAGSEMATVVTVYTLAGFLPSPPEGASLAHVTCDAGEFASRVIWTATAGERYFVQVGGAGGQTGTLNLKLDCEPACVPRNDNVEEATSVFEFELPFVEERSTTSATLQAGEPQPCANIGATVWYTFSLSEARSVTIDTAGSGFDTALALYVQPQFLPSPPGGLEQVSCNDNDGASSQSRIAFEGQAGGRYYVQAGGANGATGQLRITIDCEGCPIQIDAPESGGGQGGGGLPVGAGGAIGGPDTGSGGYAARR